MGTEAPFHPCTRDSGLTWGPTVIPRTLLGSNFIGHPKNRGAQCRSPRQAPKNYFWAGCKSNDLKQAEPSFQSHEDWPPTKTALQLCSAQPSPSLSGLCLSPLRVPCCLPSSGPQAFSSLLSSSPTSPASPLHCLYPVTPKVFCHFLSWLLEWLFRKIFKYP